MKTFNFGKTTQIVNLGDVHVGSANFSKSTFEKCVEYIKNNKDCYWVSTGDLLEISVKGIKVADVYETLSPQKELDLLLEMLRPIANKCLGIVASNHHDRIHRLVGLKLDALICQELKIPYLGEMGYLRVMCDNIGYYLALHHGIGMGRFKGGKAMNLERFGDVVKGFDIYLEGHTHSYMHFINTEIVLDRKHTSVQEVETHYVTTGHFLDYDKSYAQKLKLRAAPKGSAMLTLYAGKAAKNKKITCEILG